MEYQEMPLCSLNTYIYVLLFSALYMDLLSRRHGEMRRPKNKRWKATVCHLWNYLCDVFHSSASRLSV